MHTTRKEEKNCLKMLVRLTSFLEHIFHFGCIYCTNISICYSFAWPNAADLPGGSVYSSALVASFFRRVGPQARVSVIPSRRMVYI